MLYYRLYLILQSLLSMVWHGIHKIYVFISYIIAPPFCLFCYESIDERKALCVSCYHKIVPIVPYDFHIGRRQDITVYALSAYQDPLKKLMRAKYHQNHIPFFYIAKIICLDKILQNLDFDVITYIPLHWTRYASRGFNQSEIIARYVGLHYNKPVIPFLSRSKKTKFQAQLSPSDRSMNLSDAFYVHKKYQEVIVGKRILLIDDLFTTGSTIKSAAQVLFLYKPLKINVFVVCRAIL